LGETSWSFKRKIAAIAMVAVMMMGALAVMVPSQNAQAALSPTQKMALAQQFAPTYIFNKDENCFPVNVNYAIQTCDLYLAGSGNGTLIRTAGNYTLDQLGTTYSGPNYYLNSIYGTMHDFSNIISRYQTAQPSLGYSVYAHVIEESGSGRICIQYWTFYVFNQGKFNDHVGDWEMTQIILDSSQKPVAVGFSQHNSGMSASWDIAEKDGNHFKSYVALGSHANYYRYFQGLTGMAKDTVQGNGKVLSSGEYSIMLINEKGTSDPLWVNFAGRWGNWGDPQDDFLGQRGPAGPGFRVATGGVLYYNGFNLQSDISVQNPNMFYLDMYFYYQWYVYLALLLVPILFFVFRVRKKKRKGELKKPYLHLIDIKGADWRSIGNILAIIGIILGIVSAFFPYYNAQANVQDLGFSSDAYQDIVVVSGSTGVQINALDPEMGLTQLASFPMPFGVLITLTILTFLVSLIAVTQGKAARKYLWRGFKFVLPLILTVIMIVSLKSVIPSFAPGPGVDATQQVINAMAASPFGGSTRANVLGFGMIDFRWSLGTGAYMMVAAAVLMLIGGLMQILHKEKPKPEPQPTYQQYQQPYQQQYQQPPQNQGYNQGGYQQPYQQPPPNQPPYQGPPQRPPGQ
jgi:hypothetical protein